MYVGACVKEREREREIICACDSVLCMSEHVSFSAF